MLLFYGNRSRWEEDIRWRQVGQTFGVELIFVLDFIIPNHLRSYPLDKFAVSNKFPSNTSLSSKRYCNSTVQPRIQMSYSRQQSEGDVDQTGRWVQSNASNPLTFSNDVTVSQFGDLVTGSYDPASIASNFSQNPESSGALPSQTYNPHLAPVISAPVYSNDSVQYSQPQPRPYGINFLQRPENYGSVEQNTGPSPIQYGSGFDNQLPFQHFDPSSVFNDIPFNSFDNRRLPHEQLSVPHSFPTQNLYSLGGNSQSIGYQPSVNSRLPPSSGFSNRRSASQSRR